MMSVRADQAASPAYDLEPYQSLEPELLMQRIAAVRAEMERATEYGNRLDALGDMNSEEAKSVQKSIKYRSHRQLQEQ